MLQIFLILFTVTLAIVFFTKRATLSKGGVVHKHAEQGRCAEQPASSHDFPNANLPGYFQQLIVILKLVNYIYIQALPNYEGVQRWSDFLGKTFRWKIPFKSLQYLVTSDPVDAKRIMADPTWPDRVPVGFYCHDGGFNKPYGLFFGCGKSWKVASRVTLKLLQQLGFFNAANIEGRFVFEMQELEREFDVKMAANECGEHTFCPAETFSYLSINVVFHILFGKRNPFEDAVVTRLINSIKSSNKKMTLVWTILEVLPFLRHFPRLTFLKSFQDMSDTGFEILREVIAEKRRMGRYKEHMEDFVDGMLQHVDKIGNCQDGLNEENMLVVLRDLLFAGADTTSAVLEYGLLYMALHPQVQGKVQVEIDQVVGPDRAPTYEHRRRMPYTEAVLHEIYRMATPVPNVARFKKESNTLAPISFYGIHRNEFFFGEPYEFKPERFLDKEDPLKVVNTENLLPFGYGRRSCPAETAARVAVFVYFVVMMQKYWIRLSENYPPPSMKNMHGLTRSPLPYYITIKKRHL